MTSNREKSSRNPEIFCPSNVAFQFWSMNQPATWKTMNLTELVRKLKERLALPYTRVEFFLIANNNSSGMDIIHEENEDLEESTVEDISEKDGNNSSPLTLYADLHFDSNENESNVDKRPREDQVVYSTIR